MRPTTDIKDPSQMQLTVSERVPLVIVAFLVALALPVLGAAAAPGAGAQPTRTWASMMGVLLDQAGH